MLLLTLPMSNIHSVQSAQNRLPRRLQHPEQVTTVRSVWQDNPAPPTRPPATPQPAPPKKDTRTAPKNTQTNSTYQKKANRGKDVQLNLWVRPVIKAELERVAKREGISVSAAGEALLEHALQQDLHTQHAALLDTAIEKAIGKHMRSYSNRLAVLLVRSLYTADQTRSIVTNILSRQNGITQHDLAAILTASDNKARGNITRLSPQLKTLIEAVQKQFEEEVIGSG